MSAEAVLADLLNAASNAKVFSLRHLSRANGNELHMEHLVEQIRGAFLRICIKFGRESPRLSTPVTAMYLAACQELASHPQSQDHAEQLSELVKHAADVFFLSAHSRAQQDVLIFLWKMKSSAPIVEQETSVQDEITSGSPKENVRDAAEHSLQQIVSTMAWLH
jgi:hypothetical protein